MDIEINSRSLLTVIFRHRTRFLAVFGLVALIGLFVISGREKVYEASGSFVVKFGQEARTPVNSPDKRVDEPNPDSREIIQSYVKIMTSADLLRGVVASVGVDKAYPDLVNDKNSKEDQIQVAALILEKSLTVEADNKSNVIEIHIKHKDAAIAAALAKQFMNQFLVRQIQVYNTPQTSFLKEQIGDIKVKLDESQQAFLDFKKGLAISDLDEEMNQLLQEKRDISGMAFEAVTKAQENLSELEGKAADLRATYKDDSTVMKKMEEGIAQAKAQLEQRKAELDEITTPDSPLAKRLIIINERLAFLEQQRGRYNELKQNVEMNEENYKYYQQRGEEARANNVLNQEAITRVSIVDVPTVPMKPLPAHRLMILLAAMFLASVLGLIVVTLSELVDEKFSTPEQLKASYKLPVLATFDKDEAV